MTDSIKLTSAERVALLHGFRGETMPVTIARRLRTKGLVRFAGRGVFVDTWQLTDQGLELAGTLSEEARS